MTDSTLELNQRMLNLFVFISFQTPLHLSAQKGHIETCRVLLQSNADVHARDKKWRPPVKPPRHCVSVLYPSAFEVNGVNSFVSFQPTYSAALRCFGWPP